MDLYIVRHGIAIDREDPKCPPDPERYLTQDGIEKTKQAAKGVLALGITADVLISSPYVRAMQTAEIFASALGFSKQKIRHSDLLLPGAEPTLFFRELAKDKHSSAVFVFGHAPHLDELIAAAFAAKHNITALKKSGVAALTLKRISPPSAQLLWLATPKILRRAK
ncbi:MAG: phosphohistidine phosphatase SixA [Acidobacteriota bacterium]|nr:phosphohistidine phosphatase SixA [Acidobacteriota bacterium]